MSLSDMRPGTFVLLILGGAVLWLAARGRLYNTIQAMETGTNPGTSGTGNGVSSLPVSGGGAAGGAPFPSTLFGFQGTYSGRGDSSPFIASADAAGLQAIGGGPLGADVDFGATRGQPIALPPGSGYTFLGDQYGGWGHLLGFRDVSTGGVFEVAHEASVAGLQQGGTYAPGTVIGTSGGQPGTDVPDSRYSTGPHVAIIADQREYARLISLGEGAH